MSIDTVNQLKEQILFVERALEEHLSTQLRGEQLDETQRDRDRRQLADLVQQVESLGRTIEVTASRTLALAEEIRREREGRTPLLQAIDDLQRVQTVLQSRLAVLDEVTRRYNTFAATFEQAGERRQAEISRIDNQVKLLDLKVTRDLTDIHQATETWMATATEQLKQVGILAKQVSSVGDQQLASAEHLAELDSLITQLSNEIDRIDAEGKGTGASVAHVEEGQENLARRIEATSASVYQAGERTTALSDRLEEVRTELRGVTQRIDEIGRKLAWGDQERTRLEQRIDALVSDARVYERDVRDRADALSRKLDTSVAALQTQADQHQRVSLDHLRRTVAVLQDQLIEIEGIARSRPE